MEKCNSEKFKSLIFPYGMGLLSDSECSLFEEHLMDCDDCLSELQKVKPLVSVMRRHRTALVESLRADGMDFESLKKELLASYRKQRPARETVWQKITQILETLRRPRVLVPVVGFALVLVLSFYIILPVKQQIESPFETCLSFEKLPYQPIELRNGMANEAEQYYLNGMEDYLEDDYASAISKLRRAVRMQPDEGKWWLRLGVCYFLNRQPEPAIEALTKADELTQLSYKIRTRWYLAQSYLLKGDSENAVPLLEWVAAQDRTYADEANSSLKSIHTITQSKREK